MDWFSHETMRDNLFKHSFLSSKSLVMDLGSYDVNGNFKDLFSCDYVGVDIDDGPNVDVVMPSEYVIPIRDNYFDLLISGSCFEHCRNPFKLMKEAVRVLKPDGLVIVMVPYFITIHKYPIDCWRFLPDGMNSLFEESRLQTIETYLVEKPHIMPTRRQQHCWGIATK